MDNIRNFVIRIDEEVVGGCVDFETSSSSQTMELRQYLSSDSYAVVGCDNTYRIKLILTGNNKNYSDKELFELAIEGNGSCIVYNNCSIISEREFTGNKILYREITIGSGERVTTYKQ